MTNEFEQGQRFLRGLPDTDGPERADEVRNLMKEATTSEWARKTIIQVYRMAGDDVFQVSSVYDCQMLLTAVEDAPDELLRSVENDIERMLQRWELAGAGYRALWNHMRKKRGPNHGQQAA